MKCDIPNCKKLGTYWHIEINQENTRVLQGNLCIEHYHEFLDVIKTLRDWKWYRIKAVRDFHIDPKFAETYGIPEEERDGEAEVTLELTVDDDGKLVKIEEIDD